MDSGLPENWVPPNPEEVEEYAVVLALLDAHGINTMAHVDMVINQDKLTTFAILACACWDRTGINKKCDIGNAPAVYQQLVVNRTRGAKWLVQIDKALARAGTLTVETTWTQMNQAPGVHNAKILTPTFKKQLHAETKPVAFAHLLRNFMMLITAQMRGSRLGMHSASVPQPNQHDGVFT
jgi:hypothetical protein